ncbi:MAG: AraC family ligand binding domain-containing protein, partial [Deltaproteobacteria bacterium]|nr:AraC family ligand binding domain-containing protein [Deltaproteobacteria bacterium]
MTASPSQHRACLVAADPWSRSWLYDGGRRLAFDAAAHTHDELALIEDGDATYVIARRVVHVSAGQLAWIPPGFEHRTSFGTRSGRSRWASPCPTTSSA